jgi:hypothetical protein
MRSQQSKVIGEPDDTRTGGDVLVSTPARKGTGVGKNAIR